MKTVVEIFIYEIPDDIDSFLPQDIKISRTFVKYE